MAVKSSRQRCWFAARIGLDLRRDVTLDDPVGVADPFIGAFAGRDMDQLLRGSRRSRPRPALPDIRRANAAR